MTRTTGSGCAVMCNFINTHTRRPLGDANIDYFWGTGDSRGAAVEYRVPVVCMLMMLCSSH